MFIYISKYSSFPFLWFVGVLRIILTDQICIILYNLYNISDVYACVAVRAYGATCYHHFQDYTICHKEIEIWLVIYEANSFTMVRTRCQHLRNSLWNPKLYYDELVLFIILVWKGIISQFPNVQWLIYIIICIGIWSCVCMYIVILAVGQVARG